MNSVFLFSFLVIYHSHVSEAADCGAYTGAVVRQYDFDYTSNTVSGAALSNDESPLSHTSLGVVLTGSQYTIDCDCGIITTWMFFAWRAGTVVFYVLDGTTVKGTSSFNIGEQSKQNFFEVPLSSDMWIPVKRGYTLGFFTVGEPMITYENTAANGIYESYYRTGQSLVGVGGTVQSPGTTENTKKYAVAAYVIKAHSPMFINAPFEATLYTHETGTVVYTASALDLDGTDTLTYSKQSGNADFVFDTSARTLTYSSKLSENTYNVTLEVTDGCNSPVTATVRINLVNEGPRFTNLPASTTVTDSESAQRTIYTFTSTDPSGDDLTCSLYNTNPSGPFTLTKISNGVYNIIQPNSPSYDYGSKKYYDLRISCTDSVTTIYSNFQVDVIKNEAPTFTAGTDGFVPNSISVDRTASTSIYQLSYSDAESDSPLTFTRSCGGSCPFSISSSGEITTTAVLEDEGYDLDITMSDNHGNEVIRSLSVITSGRPYTFNVAPVWTNLPATKYVMENTPVGTSLFKVMYRDENPTDTFTMAKDSVTPVSTDTYFQFDATTGIISVKAEADFENTGPTGWEMRITINDGTQPQHNTITGTITFTLVNVNEGPTITIPSTSLTADETTARGTAFSPATGATASDPDVDTMYFTMDCGDDSKYFYLDTATMEVKFARAYDMDSGLSGTATCNVSVRDAGGFSDSGQITLTINNINDHSPKFPYHTYVFFVTTSTPFFTEISNMAATDLDSTTFGSTNGVLTYGFDPASPTEDYFQINTAGVLFVRNVASYTGNTYVFKIIATDSGGLEGTCTVTVIFTTTTVTTTTTTERMLTFEDDYVNYIWLFLLGFVILAIIIVITVIVWKDPKVNEYMNFKLYKLCEWCRKKPKPKKPRRHVEKLRVMINKKDLENDPDNALPWELLAKDNDVPEVNEVQEMIKRRTEKRDRDYKDFSGLPVFERGKGARPDSGRATVHSSASNTGRPDSESPKYATFMSSNGQENEDGGEGQWGDLTERRVIVTPVQKVHSRNGAKGKAEDPSGDSNPDW